MLKVEEITNTIICADCLEIMKQLPDKCVSLCLTDPPYGLKWSQIEMFGKKCAQTLAVGDLRSWDIRPSLEHFQELKRVSKNQIVWGGNYFADILGAWKEPIIWNKKTGNNSYADGELAWTSFPGTLRIYTHQWCGAFKDSERGIPNVHPTQKPLALFEWILNKYSKPGDIILDPFLGSGTTVAACINLERQYIGIEISPEYVHAAKTRIDKATAQRRLFI
jgi:site-specific DNA-methyltransferase (adenine-specific)